MRIHVFNMIIRVKGHVFIYVFLILTMLSWLSLVAIGLAHSFLNFYDEIINVGNGVVITSQGFSPLTVLISKNDVEKRLSDISNISIEYHLITPVIVNNKIFLIRDANISDECVLIGDDVAREIGLDRDKGFIVLSSVFRDEIFYMKICGFIKGFWLEASHRNVAKIRGVSEDYYSLAIIRGSDDVLKKVVERLGVEKSYELPNIVIAVLPRIGNISRVITYKSLSEAYTINLGLYRDYLLYFIYAVSISTLAGASILGLYISRSLNDVLKIFRYIGVSKREITLLLILIGFIIVFSAVYVGMLISSYTNIFTINIFGLVLTPKNETHDLFIMTMILSIFYLGGVVTSVLREIE